MVLQRIPFCEPNKDLQFGESHRKMFSIYLANPRTNNSLSLSVHKKVMLVITLSSPIGQITVLFLGI
jgi:hypothetical protein